MGTKIQVAQHMRDLVSHINTTRRAIATTLTNRLRDTADMVRRVGRLRLETAGKAKVVRTKCHPAALYGCDACTVSCKASCLTPSTVLEPPWIVISG